jgi:raffinose/stachyose/melibiose transport system permease protein
VIGRARVRIGSIVFQAFMIALSLVVVFPLLYLVMASFKNKAEVNRPLSLPSSFFLDNYSQAFANAHFFNLLANSVIVVVLTLAILIVICALAAYPLSRNGGRFYKVVYLFLLTGLMVPFQAGMIPLYVLLGKLGLVNNLLGLVFIDVGVNISMAILIYCGFMKTIPREIEESAFIYGCGRLRMISRIVFPLLVPATVSVILITLIPVWNDFLSPLIFISSELKKTLPVGIYNFMSARTVSMGPIFAFSVLTSLFPVLLFLFCQNYLYKGIVAGAVKG